MGFGNLLKQERGKRDRGRFGQRQDSPHRIPLPRPSGGEAPAGLETQPQPAERKKSYGGHLFLLEKSYICLNSFKSKKDEIRKTVPCNARYRSGSGLHQRGGGKSVLIDASQLNQTFTAAQTGETTVAFTALEPWTATLEETTRAEPAWVGLDKYAGDAGEASITITILEENTTDKTRTATLTITCGDTRVTIRIEQRAADDAPDNPDNPDNPNPPASVKQVYRIDYLLIDNCEKEQRRETVSQTFRYSDDQVAEILEEYDLSKEKGSTLYRIDYSAAGKIKVTVTDTSDGKNERISLTEALLDEKGRMTESVRTDYNSDGGTYYSNKVNCTYDSEGRIGAWRSAYSYMGDGNLNAYSENKFFYDAEGLLTRYSYFDSQDNDGFEGQFPAAEFYPNRIANDKANLDFMFLAMTGSSYDLDDPQVLFSLLRLTGGGFGTCLPEKTQADSDDNATPGIAYDGWPTPNVTVHESYTYVAGTLQEDEYLPLNFTMDADGSITRMAYEVPYAEYLHEYDIVVGDELLHEDMAQPDYPEEYKRYKYEIKNRKTTKQRDIVNPVTIDITYR